MTIQEINKAYNRIIGSLDCRELKNAFDYLQGLIAGIRDYSFQDKLNELQETYKYMLRYRIEGVKDPMEEQIYIGLLTSTYELADTVRCKVLTKESSSTYYNHKRMLQNLAYIRYTDLHQSLYNDHPAVNISQSQDKEAALINLFNKIWLSGFLTSDEADDIKGILKDRNLSYLTGCQIVSSLMLGLQVMFDKEKVFLLFDAANCDNEEVRVRALICLLLVLYIYRKRTAIYPQIKNRLSALFESYPNFSKELRAITLRFISARETEKITRKLQDEILPEMMKLSPKISKKINLKDLTPEQLSDEMNPEWQEMISNSSIGEKMKEFGELQSEGADIMHSTFVHLKSFPFFHEISNWLLPFSTEHASLRNHINQDVAAKQLLESMALTPFMCNSDKYSLFFSVMQLSGETRTIITEQLDSQSTEMMQQNKEELVNQKGLPEIITRQYIQDLYRFFKLFPEHLNFDDIFTYPLDFHNLPILQPYISDEESLIAIAEYYLHKNYFNDALVIYNRLAETNQDSDILFQKIGYCKQMNDDINGALEAYLHADLLHADSKWVIRRIAGCYRSLKQPEMALKYFHRYEKLNPDNLSVQISIGHCHLELKDYNEALKYYFKVDYLDNKSNKAWRPIAWCSFLTGKYDQARNYYKKILDKQPNMQDFLNAGHTEWALQNIKGALAFYKKAVKMESDDFLKFQEQFNQDIPDLLVAGIEQEEVPFMLDQLRYMLSDNFN